MPYTVEIAFDAIETSQEDDGLPLYLLPYVSDTVADTKDAAVAHVTGLDRDPATVLFAVTDQNGLTIMTSAEATP